MATPTFPIQQIALGEQVADALRRMIISGEIGAGARLIEVSLAEQFGVSRGPVREAIARLEAEGLVASGRQGSFVIGMESSDVDELYSLRQALESLAVTLLVARRDALNWERLETALAAMRQAAAVSDQRAFAAADIDFHSAIYELAGHRRLLDVWRGYEKSFGVVLEHSGRHGLDLNVGAEDHAQLLASLRESSLQDCLDAVRLHLENAHKRLSGFFAD